ncbi:MAG TPA: hypothetical protein VJ549_05390 [Geothrix sp.]|nr:hypothetical protein [Geothrix sp.]
MARKTMLSVLALAAIGSLGLRAEDPTGPWFAGIDLNKGSQAISGDLPGGKGLSIHAGRTFWTGFAGTGYRLTAEVGTLSDTAQLTQRDVKYTQAQLGGELIVNTPVQHLKFILGVNVNKLKVSSDYDSYTSTADGLVHPAGNTSHTIAGLKLGGKLGLEYFVDRHWSVRCFYQIIEAGTSSEQVTQDNPLWTNGGSVGHYHDQGKYSITPAWLQLGVSYHF